MAKNDCSSSDEFFSSSQRRLNSNTTSKMDDDDDDLSDEESMNDIIEEVESIYSIITTEDDEDHDTSSTQTEEENNDTIITLKGGDRLGRDKITTKNQSKGHEQTRNTSLKIADCERQCLQLARSLGCVTVLQPQPPSPLQLSPVSRIAAGESSAPTSTSSSLKRCDSRRSSIASGSTSTSLIGCRFVSTSFDNDDIRRRRSSSLSLWLGLKEEEQEGATPITRSTPTSKKDKTTMSKSSIITAVDTVISDNDAIKNKECATSSSSIISCSTPTPSKKHTKLPNEIVNNADATMNQCGMKSRETRKAATPKMRTINDDITKLCLSPSSSLSSSSTTFDGTSTGTTTTISSSSSCSYNHDMKSRKLLLPSKVSLWEQLHRQAAQRNEGCGDGAIVPVKNDGNKAISRSLHGNFKVNKKWNNNNNEQGAHHVVLLDETSNADSTAHTVVHQNDFRCHQYGRSMQRRGDHRDSRAQSLMHGDVVVDGCEAGASMMDGTIERHQDNTRQALSSPSSFFTNIAVSDGTCIGRDSSRKKGSAAVIRNNQHLRRDHNHTNPNNMINHSSAMKSDDSDTTWRTRLHHLLTSVDPIRESAGTGGETLNTRRRAATGTDLPPLLRARTGISQSLHGYFKSNRHHCNSHFEMSHFAPTTSDNTNTTKRKTLRSGLSQSLHGLRSTVGAHSTSTPTTYYKWCDNEITISIKNKEGCTAEQQQHNKQHQRSLFLKKHRQEKKQSSRNNNVAATKQIYFGPDECFNVEVHKHQTLQTKNKRQLSNRSLYSELTRNLHLKQKHGTS